MAMPPRHPGSLMTRDEWVALPEDNTYRYELQEGVLLVSPRVSRRHRLAAQRLSQQLDGQLPVDWESVLDMEMVVRAEYPPIVRVPDMVLVSSGGWTRGPIGGVGRAACGRDHLTGIAPR